MTDMTGTTEPTEPTEECDHDWQVVNHDENRDIYKCTKCGALRRE
jgi:hypothetical protein